MSLQKCLCIGNVILVLAFFSLLLSLRQQSFSEAFELNNCECGGPTQCKCERPVQKPGVCVPKHRIKKCGSHFSASCMDHNHRHSQGVNCSTTTIGQVTNIQGTFEVSKTESSLRLMWDLPSGEDEAAGFIVNLFSPPTMRQRRMDFDSLCACVTVPPCVRSLSVIMDVTKELPVTATSSIAACLRNLSPATDNTSIPVEIISLPIEGDMSDARVMAPKYNIKVPSCAELSKNPDKLSNLCKMKLKYRLPNISKRPPNVTVLTNDEYFVSWRLLPSMTPVKHVQLLVSFEASARLGDIHMPGEHMPQQKASKVSQHTFAFTLPPNATNISFHYNGTLSRHERCFVSVSYMADKTAAFKMYSEDPEVVAALREELIPNAEFSDSTRREYIDGFYEEMTEAAPVPHSIPLHRDGGYSLFRFGPCRCNGTRLATRTCDNPPPSQFGADCSRQGASFLLKPCNISHLGCESKSTYNIYRKDRWYSRPVFYATVASALGLICVAALLLKLYRRARSRYARLTDSAGFGVVEANCGVPSLRVTSKEEEKPDFEPPYLESPSDSTASSIDSLSDALLPETAPMPRVVAPDMWPLKKSVYISYSRLNENHVRNVKTFAEWLNFYGVEVFFDKYDSDMFNLGMAPWIESRIMSATKVIAVQSADYYNEWYADANQDDYDDDRTRWVGLEARIIQTQIMQAGNQCIPVFLGHYHKRDVVPGVIGARAFRITEEDARQAVELLCCIGGIAEHARPVFDHTPAEEDCTVPTGI